MTVEYEEDAETKTVELTVAGKVTREDYDRIVDRMQGFIDTQGTVKLIEVIESLDGFAPSVIWPGIKFDFKNLRHISHVAVVSDIGWIGPVAKAAGALVSTKLRTYDLDDLDAAREWIASE
ncbi:hypothetical protein FIU89_16460 [Roseovarius sp. THAF27]|uniref:STAS/SEC14 domain-containing protein n=1 Tax=Roseovarius sp. THAF27 TaxID=2587850 RepID=UPI0012A7CE3B|nr:STAS/SEC14 domain-containing protein [Roseovarius sp. THAF27]QFT82221.1 hypothetical protein FIU89_16460 [Roseovarius sp. THAF27]